jgi:lysophospholipase L1-like esterase
MPLAPRNEHSRSHPRRAVRRFQARLEPLEVRSLPSSAAVIQWSMVPQIAPDPAHGGAPDLPNTPAYVNPPDGYGVQLDASQSVGIQPTTTFSWTVTDSQGHSTLLNGEDPLIDLPQGPYAAQLTATGLLGTDGPQTTTTNIQVKDILIVSIGDSYASGEGNPVVPGAIFPQWAYSSDPAMNTENADAHRSTIAAPAQFALQLQQSNPHEAVTFVSVANSGASIPVGVLGPMASVGDPSRQLPAEITEVRQIIGTRHIDVLTVTVGANDIGFSTLTRDLIENTYLGYPSRAAILAQFRASLAALPQHYAALAQAIQALDPGQVLMTGYPDFSRNQRGKVAAFLGPGGATLISKRDTRLASQKIIPALDEAIAQAASTYHWTLVRGIPSDFRTHGYPSTTPWIRTLGQSLLMQGDADGTFHPNAAGHQDIAMHLMAIYMGTIDVAGGGRGAARESNSKIKNSEFKIPKWS